MNKDYRRFHKEEEADMGIGTMIVFIAMILVSAVAAGLLINTAYEVQQQAEETGRIAILNVATSFQIINAIGDRDIAGTGTDETTIRGLELKIGLVAGSPDTLMDNVIIEITTATQEENLFFDTNAALQHDWNGHDATDTATLKAAATAGTDYTAQELRDPNSDFYESTATASDYVVSQGAMLRVFISLSDPYIGTQDWVLLKIIPKHGVPTVWQGTAPEAFTDRYIPL